MVYLKHSQTEQSTFSLIFEQIIMRNILHYDFEIFLYMKSHPFIRSVRKVLMKVIDIRFKSL